MPSTGYRIVDEPLPGPLHRAVVNPIWPMFAMMLGGAWLAWPWFLFNDWAMGSPRLARNAGWVAIGVGGSVALTVAALALVGLKVLPESAVPYAQIELLLWKLLVTYVLTLDQERSFELHQHFGGHVANGMWMMLLGAVLLDRTVERSIDGLAPGPLKAVIGWVLA